MAKNRIELAAFKGAVDRKQLILRHKNVSKRKRNGC